MPQTEQNGSLLIALPINQRWPYGANNLKLIYDEVKSRQQEEEDSIKGIKKEFEEKDDGSNGFMGDSMSRVTYENDKVNFDRYHRHAKNLQQLKTVEQKILMGEYDGRCVHCKTVIDLNRLKFLPEVDSCTKCAKRKP